MVTEVIPDEMAASTLLFATSRLVNSWTVRNTQAHSRPTSAPPYHSIEGNTEPLEAPIAVQG